MTPDLALLTAAAAAGVRLVMLQRRLRVLERQAITDPLTGAFNRRHLQTALTAAAERRRRNGERASLLLIDVDRFKAINDGLGHAEGDRVLRDLVALLGQRLRKLDGLYRSGGEEFALLLAGAPLPVALTVAEHLRRLVHDAGLLPGVSLSISIGVAELAAGQPVAEWTAAADAALYRAKRAGRNRVAGLVAPLGAAPAPRAFPVGV